MLKKLALYFGLAASLNMNAFALVGGPWDGGDFSLILDDVGIYQASYRFKNGTGWAQWGNNVDLGPSTAVGGGGGGSTATTQTSVGSVLNRSLIYYKGITYFGNATGIADFEARRISGMTNGQSEVTLSNQTTTTTSGGFFLFGTSNQVQASTTAVNNGGRGFVANSAWNGKITKTHPLMRFRGEGEITFLGGDDTSIVSAIAQSILTGVNSNLTPQAVPIANQVISTTSTTDASGNVSTTTTTFARDPAEIIADQRLLLNFGLEISQNLINSQLENLEQLRDYLTNSPDAGQNAVSEKLKVYGVRRFFLSERQ